MCEPEVLSRVSGAHTHVIVSIHYHCLLCHWWELHGTLLFIAQSAVSRVRAYFCNHGSFLVYGCPPLLHTTAPVAVPRTQARNAQLLSLVHTTLYTSSGRNLSVLCKHGNNQFTRPLIHHSVLSIGLPMLAPPEFLM